MTQHSIDLLPESVRARSQAGVRTGCDAVGACVLAVLLLVAAATHVRLKLNRVQAELGETEQQANAVLSAEARIVELEGALETLRHGVDVYERIAVPLSLGRVIATVVSELPPSVTIERFDLETEASANMRSARSRAVGQDESQPRHLTAELAGFAATDQEVANLIAVLDARDPFEQVSLDFSRTRFVRGRTAREFRLSFKINLDRSYEVTEAPAVAREVARVR